MLPDAVRALVMDEHARHGERFIDVDDLDPTDPDVQLRFDAHFATEGLPGPGDPAEYAVFFERLHPTALERQRAIARVLDQAAPAPNLGHVVLALLWLRQLARVVWTTNFDDVLEQAATLVSGAPRWLRRVDRTEPAAVGAVFDESPGPVLVKLHGDFQSTKLDNTVGCPLRVHFNVCASQRHRYSPRNDRAGTPLGAINVSGPVGAFAEEARRRVDETADALERAEQAARAARVAPRSATLPADAKA